MNEAPVGSFDGVFRGFLFLKQVRARGPVCTKGAMRSTMVACFVVLTGCGPMMMTVDAGPPELICDPAVTMPVTLAATVQAQIFDKQCKSCHNAFDASNGDYSDAARTAAAVAKNSRVVPGLKVLDPNNLGKSVLWLKLNNRKGPAGESLGGVMPPGGALPADQQKLVKDWICTGGT